MATKQPDKQRWLTYHIRVRFPCEVSRNAEVAFYDIKAPDMETAEEEARQKAARRLQVETTATSQAT